jgi:AhpD family alkylhydroperoxidase
VAGQAVRESIQGQPFNDILNELHAHTFAGAPGESDPFTLSELEREYIAYALGLYYQCEHCVQYHGRVVERVRKKAGVSEWAWRDELLKVVLFLRTIRTTVSPMEWDGWMDAWRRFAGRLHHRHPGLACNIAYAVGIARADENLMELAFESLRNLYPDDEILLGVIRDIDRVVVFMKAATSKNRTDPIVRRQLGTRGIAV